MNFSRQSLQKYQPGPMDFLRTKPRPHNQPKRKGDHAVEAVRYSLTDQSLWINKTQCFKPVPQAVWDFHIGAYRVLDKYLKSRKGRNLSLHEVEHIAVVADCLAFAIEQMAEINKVYQGAFGQRG